MLGGAIETHRHTHGLAAIYVGAFGTAATVHQNAAHPGQPLHLEACDDEVESPTCVACLAGLSARALHPGVSPFPQRVCQTELLQLELDGRLADPGISRAGGRSPPLA